MKTLGQKWMDANTGRFLVRTTNALGHFETRDYDARTGETTGHTGPNGLVTTWSFDGLGRKILETRPDNTTTAFDYAACDTSCPALAVMRFTTTPAGQGASISYRDVLGREVLSAKQGFNGAWIYQSTAYDALGRAFQVSEPYFSGEAAVYTVKTYDALQRVNRVTAPGNRVATTAYNGLTTTVTNPLNQTTTTVKDSEGHVIETVDALFGRTLSAFDPFGNLVQITDPAGNLTTMRYDRLGRRVETNDPDRGKRTYTYDVLGQLSTETDAKNQTATHVYDLLGRLHTRTTAEGISGWVFDYCRKGKLCYVGAPGYAEWHQYDALGRQYYTAQNIGGINHVFTKTFDAYSRLDVLTYPSGYTLKHLYDGTGHLVELQDAKNSQSYWKATVMDARGHLTRASLAGGMQTAGYSFDANTGNPTSTITVTPSTQIRYGTYYWDAAGNLTRRSAYFVNETFSYDNLNRLTAVTGPANKNFQYDAIGNLTFKSDVGTYTYLAAGCARPHAVCSIAGSVNTSFQYDANGNLLSGNGQTLSYTSFNQPSTITAAGTTATLAYGADQRRTLKTVNGGTTHYAGQGRYERVINGATTTHRHYIYAGATPIALYAYATSNGVVGSPSVTYLHTDPWGSLDTLTDPAGKVLQRLSYDAWGRRRNVNGTDAPTPLTALNPRGYTGHEHDDELRLIHMQAREYDPLLARFLTPDPLGIEGDPHPYGYANHNPFRYTDPTGTSFVDFAGNQWGSGYGENRYVGTRGGYSQFTLDNYGNVGSRMVGGSSWSSWNASSSLGAFGSRGTALTSFNTAWNSGGMGRYVAPQYSLGAGRTTGTPSFSSMIPVYGPAQQAYNDFNRGNIGSGLLHTGLMALDLFPGVAAIGMVGDVGRVGRGAVATAESAQNIMNSVRLSRQLSLESANSAFTASGRLSEGAIKGARQIFEPGTLSNPAIPSGFGKYTTDTFASPSGPFQVHFYMNPTTDELFLGMDYKAVFNSGR